jgi:hypothetical protein
MTFELCAYTYFMFISSNDICITLRNHIESRIIYFAVRESGKRRIENIKNVRIFGIDEHHCLASLPAGTDINGTVVNKYTFRRHGKIVKPEHIDFAVSDFNPCSAVRIVRHVGW